MIAVWIGTTLAVLALAPAGLRWLRVAQREHYLAGATGRFALRWWRCEPANVLLVVVALAGLAASTQWPLTALATAGAMSVGPLGLSLLGRTSKLVATPRLRRLVATWLVLQAGIVVAGALSGFPAPLAAGGLIASPLLVDAACALNAPLERHLVSAFVTRAKHRLERVRPRVVGVTGSFGKTSTKNHIQHLLSGSCRVVASPASFNNRAGLARAVNEQLVDGTEVFVAEMGTYGPGEIAELCSWCPPEIAVITAIGPVHLERFGSEEAISNAKAEITEPAHTVVLNVDDDRLARLASRLSAGTGWRTVIRCSALDKDADVFARRNEGRLMVMASGQAITEDVAAPVGVQPVNLACAVAVALQLGVPTAQLSARIESLPPVANRLVAATAPSGVAVIDDTFNANPSGARVALTALAEVPVERRRVVVTPGMVELGPRQVEENEAFGAAAAGVATDFVVVGRTNRRALRQGARSLNPVQVRTREEAVAWVKDRLGRGDAVLYENDLPDHYP